jgi:hypothetical protein
MKRIENYRKGDRAEKLGVVLLQAFCAVAEVPRQEDFGLMDAVATLLRRDGRLLYAEDSFLVQFKSRTETRIEYSGEKFEALLSQDLPLLVARVDLTTSNIELHSLGIALAHLNVSNAKGLVAHLQPDDSCPFGLVDDLFQVPLRKPILKWNIGDLQSRAFADKAYAVLKAWMSFERWNRRYRRAGIGRQICWETNAVPTDGGEFWIWSPDRSQELLSEISPVARVLAFHGISHPEMRDPARAIFSWLRKHDIEADPDGSCLLMLDSRDCQDRLTNALDSNLGADVAVAFSVVGARPDFLDFWLYSKDRKGNGGGRRHTGSLQHIREQGIEVSVNIVGNDVQITISLTDSWLKQHHLEDAAIRIPDSTHGEGISQVILLKRPPSEVASS